MITYDLADYICPANGLPFTLSSNEACQSIKAGDGWIEFRKNKHVEEFYVSADVIGRGADTSLISTDGINPTGTFYVQYAGSNDTPIYGCPWAARHMSIGQVYHRTCMVIVYDYTGKELNRNEADTDLTLKAWHDTILFPSGQSAHDVLEFQWDGEEVYYYAKGFGLVGWKNLTDGSFGNYVQRYTAAIQTPFPHAISRPLIIAAAPSPAPLPNYPKASDMGLVVHGKVASSDKVNVRDLPSAKNGVVIASLVTGDLVDYHANKTTVFDGHQWLAVEMVNGKVQTGWIASDVITFTIVQPKEKVLTDLGFVYLSQLDGNANLKDNDCSLAASISAALTTLKNLGYGPMPLLTVNNLVPYSRLKGSYDGLVSMADLEAFMSLLGVKYTYSDGLTPAVIQDNLQRGFGILALMNYVCLNAAYRFGHYACIVGLAGNDTFIVNDPYLMGEGAQVSRAKLQVGLTDLKGSDGSSFASKPYQGYILTLK